MSKHEVVIEVALNETALVLKREDAVLDLLDDHGSPSFEVLEVVDVDRPHVLDALDLGCLLQGLQLVFPHSNNNS